MCTDSVDSPDTHSIHQFLSLKLSETGLPYAKEHKWLIRKHFLDLTDEFPTMLPKTAVFTHNNGRSSNLLKADGTIPMTYQGVTYYIPTVIWLPEMYPNESPLVFVNPTPDMIIKRGHHFVDMSDGMVSAPYLLSWSYPASNLVELGRNLSQLFGDFPPLYSKPSSDYSRSNSDVSSSNHGGLGAGSLNSRSFGRNLVDKLAGIVLRPRDGDSNNENDRDHSSVLKMDLMEKVAGIVHSDVLSLSKMREEETEKLMESQSELRQRQKQVDDGLMSIQEEIERLGEQWQIISMHSNELEMWLKETEADIMNSDIAVIDHDNDDFFEPSDDLSRRMLESTATDLAIEDVICTLDREVQGGRMPFEEYLRYVRSLSREQFFHRATSVKVSDARMQADVAAVSARIQQYVK